MEEVVGRRMQTTTAIRKLYGMTKRVRIVQGGTWAGKTFGIIVWCHDFAANNPGMRIGVVGRSIPAVSQGPLRDYMDLLQSTDRWEDERYNGTKRRYTYSTRSTVEFTAFEDIGKVKQAGKWDVVFINEAQYIPYPIADALVIRTERVLWVDFNPTHRFWAHTELLNLDYAEFLLLKYTDNEALPANILRDLMERIEKSKTSEYWANWCRVYIDGDIGKLEGSVFQDWDVVEGIPEDAFLCCTAIDFGFSGSSAAVVDVWMMDDEIYLDERLYGKGFTDVQIAEELKDIYADWEERTFVCDSADPKARKELLRAGIRVYAAPKGPDSVPYGIKMMQSRKHHITAKSDNLVYEFQNYRFREDPRTGKPSERPVKEDDHAIDAARYGEMWYFNAVPIVVC